MKEVPRLTHRRIPDTKTHLLASGRKPSRVGVSPSSNSLPLPIPPNYIPLFLLRRTRSRATDTSPIRTVTHSQVIATHPSLSRKTQTKETSQPFIRSQIPSHDVQLLELRKNQSHAMGKPSQTPTRIHPPVITNHIHLFILRRNQTSGERKVLPSPRTTHSLITPPPRK